MTSRLPRRRALPSSPLASVAISLAFALLFASSAVAADLEPVREMGGISEYRLSNGLKVLLFPDESSSTVTVNVTYLVGSRHEGRGEAGMAHLLEHMVFKGSTKFDNIWGALQDHGANFNGTTWVDRTNYFETLPASEKNLEFALEMEADRMVNSFIDGDELAKEMTVVRNEFEMGENYPTRILLQRVMAAAYEWHNYGKSTIGNRSDLERVPVENLQAFYRRYYQPDNAMLVIAGKFDPEWAKQKVVETFGAIPEPERDLLDTWTEEPVQDGSRFVELRRVGSTAAAMAAYHVPPGSHPEMAALDVLTEVLGDEPSGRLYETLVETEKAVSARSFVFPFREPGLLFAQAETRDDQDVDAVLASMTETLEGVGGTVTEEEVEQARARLLKSFDLLMTDSQQIGIVLSEYEALGDWRLLYLTRDLTADVTVEQVNAVAEKYLIPSNRTSGVFYPVEDEPVRAEIPQRPDIEGLLDGYTPQREVETGGAFEATAANIEQSTERVEMGNRRIALLPKKSRGAVVEARFVLPYGTPETLRDESRGAMSMLGSLLMRGTTERDREAIEDELARLQSELRLFSSPGGVVGNITTTRENLPAVLDLLGEILRQPAFPEAELEVVRKQRLADLEESLTDPQALAFSKLQQAMNPLPKSHLRYTPGIEEQIEQVRALDVEEIRSLYERFLGSRYLRASFVGDFDRDQLLAKLDETLGDWVSDEPWERISDDYVEVAGEDLLIDTPDKKMAIIARGTTFPMRDDDPDYPALQFANFVFGGSPKSNLMTALRHEGGLSYGAASMLAADDEDALARFLAYAICAPENADQAQKVMQLQFQSFVEEGLSENQLAEFRDGYRQSFQTQLGNDALLASRLLADLKTGRSFTWHAEQMERAAATTAEELREALERIAGLEYVDIQAGDADAMAAPASGGGR